MEETRTVYTYEWDGRVPIGATMWDTPEEVREYIEKSAEFFRKSGAPVKFGRVVKQTRTYIFTDWEVVD